LLVSIDMEAASFVSSCWIRRPILSIIVYHTHPNFFENQLKLLCKPLLILDTM
jgi:hypothetical protein